MSSRSRSTVKGWSLSFGTSGGALLPAEAEAEAAGVDASAAIAGAVDGAPAPPQEVIVGRTLIRLLPGGNGIFAMGRGGTIVVRPPRGAGRVLVCCMSPPSRRMSACRTLAAGPGRMIGLDADCC